MKIGIHVPQWGGGATRAGVLAVARAAESAGLDSVWVADHIVMPTTVSTRYPYHATGTTGFRPEDGFLEALTTLAVIAGATERVIIGTSVLVPVIRHPLTLAKATATLDVLSNGRLLLGLGAGWLAEEIRALGVDYRTRMTRLRETVQVLRMLWRDGRGSFHGECISFDDVVCEPRPIQPGGPAIWIGGTSDGALMRAAQYADGWHGVGSNVLRLAEFKRRLDAIMARASRHPRPITFSTSAGLPADPGVAIARLVALRDLGVDHVVLNVATNGPEESVRMIDVLERYVLPSVRSDRTHVRA